jgi:hypothetical protein
MNSPATDEVDDFGLPKTMNINAEPGSKVVYAFPNNGMKSDQAHAAAMLTVGREYEVEDTEVRSYTSYVYLKGFAATKFNTVMFKDAS